MLSFTQYLSRRSPMEAFNSCGMTVYKLDHWAMLRRFMFLGTEKGTYYITSNNLTEMHLDSLEELMKDSQNHDKIINLVKEFINKAFKVDYIIYILARCCVEKNNKALRTKGYELLKEVCRTPTQLFMFVQLYEALHKKLHGSTGWNKQQKQAISKWYLDKTWRDLVYQVTKYKNRNGWTHADVLRLAHVKPRDGEEGYVKDCLFKYITKGYAEFNGKAADTYSVELEGLKNYIRDYEEVMFGNVSPEIAISHIKQNGFVREHLSTNLLNDVDVWNALVDKMPMIAMLRNMNKITSVGVFEKYPETLAKVLSTLSNKDIIQKSKAHPMQFLIALKMYSKGRGDKGKLEWSPRPDVLSALNIAFKNSFGNAPVTNKRYLLALDVSGSMTGSTVCGVDCLMASEVSCAMSMIIAGTESNCDIMGFNYQFQPLSIKPEAPLEDNLRAVYNSTFGSTDCSLPMTWSLENNKKYDAMIVFTDSETNCNRVNPATALNNYNERMGLDCKLIVVAMSANKFTIADPENPNMLDICGFDSSTPLCISEFVGTQRPEEWPPLST